MKINGPTDVSNVGTWEELRRFAGSAIRDIITVINGGVDLVDNCATRSLTVTFTAAGSVTVDHGLGRVPRGYVIVGRTTNIQVFDGVTLSTDKLLSLQTSGAGVVRILVF